LAPICKTQRRYPPKDSNSHKLVVFSEVGIVSYLLLKGILFFRELNKLVSFIPYSEPSFGLLSDSTGPQSIPAC